MCTKSIALFLLSHPVAHVMHSKRVCAHVHIPPRRNISLQTRTKHCMCIFRKFCTALRKNRTIATKTQSCINITHEE